MQLIDYSGDPPSDLLEQGNRINIEGDGEVIELDDINASLAPLDVATRGITNPS